MKKIKKQLLIVLSVLCCVVLAIGLTACGKTEAPKDGKSAIDLWLELPENSGKTSEDFWKELKGEKGDKGDKGDNGAQGEPGKDGKSAYEIWKGLEGNAGKTEAEFIEALKGAAGVKGDKGDKGDKGEAGNDGVGIKTVAVEGNQFVITLTNDTVVKVNIPAVSNTCEHDYDKWMLQEHKTVDTMNVTLKICKKCGASVLEKDAGHVWGEVTTVKPTCTEEGYDARLCTTCGKADEKTNVVAALGHDWEEDVLFIEEGKAICEAEYFTGRRCKRCALVDEENIVAHEKAEHSVSEWALQTAPKFDAEGTLVGYCATCGKDVTKEMPKLNKEDYTFDGDIDACGAARVVNVTYNAINTITFKVQIAEKKHTIVLSDGKKHDVVDGTVYTISQKDIDDGIVSLFGNVKPTCEETGAKASVKCAADNCGKVLLVDVRFDHTPIDADLAKLDEKHYTDCTSNGKTGEFTCKYCGKKFTRDIAPQGHDLTYILTKDTVAAGAAQTFTITEKCQREGCEYSKVIANKVTVESKITKEADCQNEGERVYTYTAKDGKVVELKETIAKTAHIHETLNIEIENKDVFNYDEFIKKYGEGAIELFGNKQPTCKENGYGHYTCKTCGKEILVTLTRNHVKPAVDQITVTEATCTAPKTLVYTCTVCGEEQTETEGEALGHDFEYTLNDDNTTLTATCKRCDYTETAEGKIVKEEIPATCESGAKEKYTVTLSDKTVKVFEKVVGEPVHTLYGELAPDTKVYTLKDGKVFTFGNVPAGCRDENGTAGYYVCELCGRSILVTVKANHTKGADLKETPATCTEEGLIEYTCTVCNEKVTEKTPALGHELSYEVSISEDGVVTVKQICAREDLVDDVTVVGNVSNDKIFKAIAEKHVDSTCALEGRDVYSFEFTNKNNEKVTLEVTKVIPTGEHLHEPPKSWVKDGKKYSGYYCSNCKHYIITSVEDIAA